MYVVLPNSRRETSILSVGNLSFDVGVSRAGGRGPELNIIRPALATTGLGVERKGRRE